MLFQDVNPIYQIENNVVLTHLGDISFCYKIELPEMGTISVDKYNDIHQTLINLMLLLPENIILQRQDFFLESVFESSHLFSSDNFFDNSLHKHFQGRVFLNQKSYLYITLFNGFGFRRNIDTTRYAKRLTDVKSFEKKITDFSSRVEKAIALLEDCYFLKKMTYEEITFLIDQHLNGYSSNKVASPVFKPEFRIGDKYFSIYGLDNDLNQKDGKLEIASIKDRNAIYPMYASYMNRLGYELGFEHVVNSFLYYDNQESIKKHLESEQQKHNSIRLLKTSNNENANKLGNFLVDVERENLKIVRSHFNVSFWDTNKEKLVSKSKRLQTAFSQMGIVPTEYMYMDLPHIFLSNFPACGGHLPQDYTFISVLDIALAYFISEGTGLYDSEKGYYYCNRNNDVPFRLDTFFKPYEDKVIDNRNYFVIAPSGGGKSFSSRARLLQQYQMGFDQVVVNIGGDDKLCKVINSYGKDEALYVEYVQGSPLPINPFYVEGTISNDKIEFLISFIWLLWGGTDEISSDKSSVLNKILGAYYDIDLVSQEGGNFALNSVRSEYSIGSFYDFLLQEENHIKMFYRGNSNLFDLDSLILNLEKFAIGNYANLFLKGKPSFGEKKKYIEFELDNIKDHPFLFPIFSMLISDVTFNTMWSTDGYKDFYIDEAWKILEKPGMAVLLKYLYKTIRKFDGSVGIAVQQITDLSINEIIEKAILGNCAIKYILDHKTVTNQVPDLKAKLSLTDADVAMLLSIEKRTKKTDKIKFTEQLLVMGSSYSRIVRVETSPELSVIFDSEKSRLKKFNELYEKTGNVEQTVIKYLET